MIRDHSRTTAALKAIAAQSPGLRPPEKMDAAHRGMLEQLHGVAKRDLNSLYASLQVQGHEDAVALFSNYAAHGSNGKLRRFARKTLPALQHHLDMARQLPAGNGLTARGP